MLQHKYKYIPCDHKRGITHYDTQISDYWPLKEYEIDELLEEAFSNTEDSNNQHCMLVQAIPGIKCPREYERFAHVKALCIINLCMVDFFTNVKDV